MYCFERKWCGRHVVGDKPHTAQNQLTVKLNLITMWLHPDSVFTPRRVQCSFVLVCA